MNGYKKFVSADMKGKVSDDISCRHLELSGVNYAAALPLFLNPDLITTMNFAMAAPPNGQKSVNGQLGKSLVFIRTVPD